MTATITLHRHELERALARLSAFDLRALLGVVLLAGPITGELTAAWRDLSELLALPSGLLRDAIERLVGLDFIEKESGSEDGVHLHLGRLLVLPPALPDNLPLEL